MEQQLYWPSVPSAWLGKILIILSLIGSCGIILILVTVISTWTGDTTLIKFGLIGSCGIFTLILVLIGFAIDKQERKKSREALQKRQRTIEVTNSVLMSKAEYVGGHPIIPNAGIVLLSLSPTELTIFSLEAQYSIQPLTSIPLKDVIRAGMGRPKSANEVYDEDYGYTIDVYEHSPFLSITFEFEGETYRVSFQSFESQTPREWYNKIVSLQYQLRSTGDK